MRNLKKVLSLTLALVMLLGMMVVGAGAVETKFTDNGKITDAYKEAISVMNALKIIEGKGNNTFDPSGILTRAEAAKVLVVMTMGNKAADAMKSQTKSDVFTDMPDHWAAGLVDACYSLGIVKGTTPTTFDPEGTLTGTAFAAMLLRAVGVEGTFEGAAWEANVRVAAAKAGLSNVTNTDLPREQAAQMAFEGLTYSAEGETTTYRVSDGKEFTSAADAYFYQQSKNATISDPASKLTVSLITTYPDSLGEKIFGLSKTSDATDDFGRPATEYIADKFDLDLTIAEAASNVHEGVVSNKTLRADAGAAACKAGNGWVWTKYVDSKTGEVISIPGTSGNLAGTVRGAVTEVFVNSDEKTVDIVVTKTYVAEVKRVTPAKGETDRYVTVTGNKTFTTEDFAKDDVVLYTMADGVIKSMEKAETVTGTLERKVASSKTYTIDGTAYNWNGTVPSASAVIEDGQVGKEVTVYVDGQNNIVALGTAAAQVVDYIYILANPSAKENPDYVTGVKEVVEVYGVLADGTVGRYTVKALVGQYGTLRVSASEPVADSNDGSKYKDVKVEKDFLKGLYSYTKDPSTGYLTITPIVGNLSWSTDAKNKPTLSATAPVANAGTDDITVNMTRTQAGQILNSATQFVFFAEKDAAAGDHTVEKTNVVTGIANIGNTIDDSKAFVAVKSGVAKVVFVTSSFVDGTEDTGVKVYVTKVDPIVTADGAMKEVKVVTEDGEEQTIITKKTAAKGDIWTLGEDEDLNTKIDGDKGLVSGTITAIDGNNVYIGSTTRVFNVDDTKTVNIDTNTSDLEVGQRVVLAKSVSGKTVNDIVVVFVTEAANETIAAPSATELDEVKTDSNTNKKVKYEVSVGKGTSFMLPASVVTSDSGGVKINDNVITDWGDASKVMGFTFPINKTDDKNHYFEFKLVDANGTSKVTETVQCGGKVETGVFYYNFTISDGKNVVLEDGTTYFWTVKVSDGTANEDYNTEVAHGSFTYDAP